MPITPVQRKQIQELLSTMLKKKLLSYARETTYMPFLARLIQDSDKVAAYSFIHSVATSLGMSVYEEVSRILAEPNSTECFTRYDIGGVLSTEQKSAIDRIVTALRNGERKPDYNTEVREVLAASAKNGRPQKEGRICDLYMKRAGVEFFFEIKTVKPNIDVFTKSKQKLLEWVARRRRPVRAILAFPYNPYHPAPYSRFTQQNLMHVGHDFLVGESYWELLSGKDTLSSLLDIFNAVGQQWKQSIQTKITEVAKTKAAT